MTSVDDIMQFIRILKNRNEILFYFGLFNFAIALSLFFFSLLIDIPYLGTHALYKPVKFGISIGIYSWTMAWLTFYLGSEFHHKAFSWGISALLGFEIVYIAIQALRGQASHYNITNSFYSALYVLMAIAAALVTFWTAYVGILFFKKEIGGLPLTYLWGIRLGILMFVIFSLEGFLMGSRLSHTVGAADGSTGYWFLNWSKKFGDLRISHFFGMHALQVIPLAAYYIFESTLSIIIFGAVYFCLTAIILYVTLLGRSLI